jgi:hypothetical protein
MQQGIRNRHLQEQRRLRRNGRTSGRIFEKTIGLEIAKRTARSSVWIRKMRDWTLWRVRPLRNGKKIARGVTAGNVEAPANLGSFAPTIESQETRHVTATVV